MSPFPVTLHASKAHIAVLAGTRYKVLTDGARSVPVTARDHDVLDLAARP